MKPKLIMKAKHCRTMKSQLALLLALTLLSSSSAEEARFFRIVGPVVTTITAFGADCYLTWTNTPTNATFTVQTTSSLLSPINWVDGFRNHAGYRCHTILF